LAHFLGEAGADRVQRLFDDTSVISGTSILSFYEFELRLHALGVAPARRAGEINRYGALMSQIVEVTEAVRAEAIRLRISASAHIAAMDVLIAASASVSGAVLVHRDPHFSVIPAGLLKQESLPPKCFRSRDKETALTCRHRARRRTAVMDRQPFQSKRTLAFISCRHKPSHN
jgi:predicted nucleic acid-binding protein